MYVTFPGEPARNPAGRASDGPTDIEGIKVRFASPTGRCYDQIGKINFVDVTVDRGDDTVLVRAVIAEPGRSR